MDLSGRIINNCYIIREKLYEDSISTVWISYTLFAAKKFLLKFFKKDFFKINQKDLIALKNEMLSQSNYINHENISNILEFDEFENMKFTAIEISDGNLLINHLLAYEKINIEDVLKIILETAKGIEAFHNKGIFFGGLTPDNIWINYYNGKIVKIKLLNYSYHIFNGYGLLKNNNEYKKFISGDVLNNKNANLNNELYSIGIIAYCIVTGNFNYTKTDINKLKANIGEHVLKSKLIFIIEDLLKKKDQKIKSIYDLINSLPQINNSAKSEKIIKKDFATTQNTVAFKDMFEERRKYFDDLESERKKKLNINRKENIYLNKLLVKTETENYADSKIQQLEDHKLFYLDESRSYAQKINEKKKNHLDSIINQTRAYYKNINTADINENKFLDEYKKFFTKISNQMKKYADDLKKENINFYKSIMKKSNSLSDEYDEKDIKEEYKNHLHEAKDHFYQILEEAKKYYLNLTEESKKYYESHFESLENKDKNFNSILNETLNFYKNIEKDSKDYYSSIIDNYKKTMTEINKKLKTLKENKEIISHFNDNLKTETVKIGFMKKLFKNACRSSGNICLVEKNGNNKAVDYINKLSIKFLNRKKAMVVNISCLSNVSAIRLIVENLNDFYGALNNISIKNKLNSMSKNTQSILFNYYKDKINNIIDSKLKNNKFKENDIINANFELISKFNEIKLPLVIILNDFQETDIISLKVVTEIIKIITSKALLIFGIYDKTKINKNNFLNEIL